MRCFAKFRHGFGHGWVKKLGMGLSPGCYVGLWLGWAIWVEVIGFVVLFELFKGSFGYSWKLKLKIKKYCSKIIFKYVNSIMGPIFNEKIAKKWNLWVHE